VLLVLVLLLKLVWMILALWGEVVGVEGWLEWVLRLQHLMEEEVVQGLRPVVLGQLLAQMVWLQPQQQLQHIQELVSD
jgi:hypothetical protein